MVLQKLSNVVDVDDDNEDDDDDDDEMRTIPDVC